MSTDTEDPPKCHILNFSSNDDNTSQLTFLVNGVRFHVLVDPHQLKTQGEIGLRASQEYIQKLEAFRVEVDPSHLSNVPEQTNDSDGSSQDTNTDNSEPKTPNDIKRNQSSTTEGDNEKTIRENARQPPVETTNPSKLEHTNEVNDSLDLDLRNWIVSRFGDQVEKLAPSNSTPEQKSLNDWYNCETYFFELAVRDKQVCPVQLSDSPELWGQINDLIPRITLPKYIREDNIPWVRSDEVKVISESDNPEPIHPARVKWSESTYFFKVVDFTQPQPTKRELKLLKKIEKIGLDKKMRVPVVSGLVGYGDSKTEIMGFLLTNVEEPTPLTLLLESDVPQAKREKWAKESEKIINLLHENNIIWGDAKADNFIVDKNDDLWIIDFGGSYTDGWVDPELMETKEGDEMGIEKIINALEDPDTNTLGDFGEIDQGHESVKVSGEEKTSLKRRHEIQSDESAHDQCSKKRRRDGSGAADQGC